ncbi:ribonuclease R [Inconstantimicrobium mannanitabidum]|uniref:Ribonuclease R n=1 Tax=Inconstantimicrobium mannanitabidum TaxID=1604901 RepID=A0ACB5REZ5_9CLOT|nr:ribonuclease R [Clostridium sp. TW13]GKX67701.1 ribonuclease R [Clostridium sp. TW13]
MGIKQTLLQFMREPAYNPMEIYELAQIFDINKNEYNAFKKVIRSMEREGLVVSDKSGRVGVIEKMGDQVDENTEGLVSGKLQVHQRGFGFVIPDEEGMKDIFIPINNMNGAMNGDKVLAKITKQDTESKKCEGLIVKITDRANKSVIGVYQDSRSFGFVISEDKRIQKDIFISKKDKNGARDGDVVIVEITKWAQDDKKPEGKVKEVLGRKGEVGIDILIIAKKYGLPEEFPPKVLKFADNVEDQISEKEIKGRKDIRNIRMVTIDGEDAKDLDDAVSIERLENGNFKLGVHIADVTHYVKENNPLDKEAFKRATSVYLIDRVIPMLPKKLSNGICSLNPRVDRLALSCFMEIDHSGKVVQHEIAETVIKTSERMTYTDVTKILKDHDEELIKRYDYLYEDFKAMEELCNILNKKRMKRGAIDFDFEESKIILNELGKPIDIKPYEREIANRMIEEFMLVCNETIAEYMFWTQTPFVYRIHEDPDSEKLEKFKEFIYNLGYRVPWTAETHPSTLQGVLNMVKGKKEEMVVSTLLLRSMMQARYAPQCTGHFGLSAKYYCHFTSPIRRYPDLQIHRIIKEYLHGQINEKRSSDLMGIVDAASKQSSEMERVAQEAEREVDDLKKAEYMSERIGEEFEGIISSVTSFGMFVELPNTIEGLVHVNDLFDDYYIYDEAHLALIGERTKKTYRLGDAIKVRCENVDIENREIFFVVAGEDEEDLDSEFDETNEASEEELEGKEPVKHTISPENHEDINEQWSE